MGNFFSGQSSNQEVQDVGTGTQIYRKLHKAAFNEETKGENMVKSIKRENAANSLKEQQRIREKQEAEQKAKEAKEKAKNSCLTDPKYRLPTPKKNVPDPKVIVNGKETDLRQLTFSKPNENIDDIIFDVCYEWAGNKSVIDKTYTDSFTRTDSFVSNPLTNTVIGYIEPKYREKATKIIKYLIAAGADINIYKGILLFYAIRYKDVKFVEHIVDAGANVNIEDKDKYTPLVTAIKKNNFDIVKKLIESGADVNKAYGEGTGNNPLDVARYNKVDDTETQNKIIQLLRDKGAKATTLFNGGSKQRRTHKKRKSNKNQRKNRRTKKST
uniref:Uncharacterized protein n=1 Tax=viral metagenome TaxID=1070528 RepID=A0A6C0ATK9_9ZZZZ